MLGGLPAGGRGSALVVQPGAALKRISNVGFEYQTWLGPSTPGGFVDLNFGWFFVTPTAVDANVPDSLNGIPGALWLRGARDVVVSNCSFRHLGLSGAVVDGGSQDVTITRSWFEDLSGSALLLGNVSEPLPPPECMDANLTVSDNTIADTAAEYHGAAAIFAGYVAHTTIEHCTIDHTSNGGIVIGYGFGIASCMKANTIRHNRIGHSESVLYDTGSVYTLGSQPGSEIYGNLIVDQVLLYGSLYHDQSSAGFTTRANVVVGSKMWLYLQWGSAGPVRNIVVTENFYNQPVAGGCGSAEHAPTCHENVTVALNTLVHAGGHDTEDWPARARTIASSAGVRPRTGAVTTPMKRIQALHVAGSGRRNGAARLSVAIEPRRLHSPGWPPRPVTDSLNLTEERFVDRDISAAGGDNVGAALRLGGGAVAFAFAVVFQNLSADHGGAVYIGDGSAASGHFVNCSFEDNKATAPWGGGGAVAVFPGAAASFSSCLFARNYAYNGGALWSNGAVRALHCTFAANVATAHGGGLIAADGSAAALNVTVSTFENNRAALGGPACFIYSDMERWDPALHKWFPGTCDAPGVGCDGSDWVDPRAGLRATKNCCYDDALSLTIHRGNPD